MRREEVLERENSGLPPGGYRAMYFRTEKQGSTEETVN